MVQANNGRSDMGQFVKAGLLQSLDGYAKAYGWTDRFPESVRALASYTEDGKEFGTGNLYGLPQVGEVVGVWYNKAKLDSLGIEAPTTTTDFEAALAKAEQAGELPDPVRQPRRVAGHPRVRLRAEPVRPARPDPRPRLRSRRRRLDVGRQREGRHDPAGLG